MKKYILFLLTALLLLAAAPSAWAADYCFDEGSDSVYYDATAYQRYYTTAYNYGGPNLIDYDIPELAYGLSSNTALGAMEQWYAADISYAAVAWSSGEQTVATTSGGIWVEGTMYQTAAYTDAASLTRADGSIGTLTIPALNINMLVFEGETTESMKKGVGHFSSTSAWNGNVGICGHNRGATYTIGSIKNLSIGDTISYTTTLGTRSYAVTTVAQIANDDWSYLTASADNRITLITCAAGQPELRWCVQAVEQE